MQEEERGFQSTRPVRGATARVRISQSQAKVSIHAPRAGRDGDGWDSRLYDDVSIHAPRAGRDIVKVQLADKVGVSIHAPRAGRDGCGG